MPTPPDDFIYCLQAQLTATSQLCVEYEKDIRARDEIAIILSKHISLMEENHSRTLALFANQVTQLELLIRSMEPAMKISKHYPPADTVPVEDELVRMRQQVAEKDAAFEVLKTVVHNAAEKIKDLEKLRKRVNPEVCYYRRAPIPQYSC